MTSIIRGLLVQVGRINYEFRNDRYAEAFAACVDAGGDVDECAERHGCVEVIPFRPIDRPG